MNEYFRQHPQLFVPRRQKDLPYFGDDLCRTRERETAEQYLSYFEPARPDQRAGEVCVWYLYSESATEELHEFCPGAEIFVIVRNPVDLAHSQHSQMLYSQDEDIVDFVDALAAEPVRRRGQRIPPTAGNRPLEGLQYRYLGRVTEHIRRYQRRFGRDHVHVVVYDDFRADTSNVMRNVFGRLGVAREAEIDYRVYNGNKAPRSERVQRLLRNPPDVCVQAYRAVTPERLHGRPLRALVRLNTRYERRATLDEVLRRQLQSEFRPEVERLSELLGRDLTHWCEQTAIAPVAGRGAL